MGHDAGARRTAAKPNPNPNPNPSPNPTSTPNPTPNQVLAVLQLRYHACTSRWSPLVETRRGATRAALMRSGMEAACDLHLAG